MRVDLLWALGALIVAHNLWATSINRTSRELRC